MQPFAGLGHIIGVTIDRLADGYRGLDDLGALFDFFERHILAVFPHSDARAENLAFAQFAGKLADNIDNPRLVLIQHRHAPFVFIERFRGRLRKRVSGRIIDIDPQIGQQPINIGKIIDLEMKILIRFDSGRQIHIQIQRHFFHYRGGGGARFITRAQIFGLVSQHRFGDLGVAGLAHHAES